MVSKSQLKYKITCILVTEFFHTTGIVMNSFYDKFWNFYKFICVVILSVMVLIVFVNACMRYFMQSGFVATEEVLRYLFLYLTFLGMVAVARERGHIAVTILTDALPKNVRTVVYIIGYLLALYALYILVDGSIIYFEDSDTSRGQVTGMPYQIIVGCLIFGAFGVLLFVFRDLLQALKALFVTHEDFPPRYVDEDLKAALAKQQEQSTDNQEHMEK